jgi:hypothetical protein
MSNQDFNVTSQQIGRMNIFAISGGRMLRDGEDLLLPVSSGYRVRVHLAPNDTYTVTREMKRGAKLFVKGVLDNVYCDQLGEVCYQASCYKTNDFGGHKVAA